MTRQRETCKGNSAMSNAVYTALLVLQVRRAWSVVVSEQGRSIDHWIGSAMADPASDDAEAFGPEELLDSSNIRKLIKVGTDVTAIATDAVTLLQYALDAFLGALADKSTDSMVQDGRKMLSYKDVATTVAQESCLDFLEDIIPMKVTASTLVTQAHAANHDETG
eukprot:jgi/Ulvmu1/7183/UM034_0092.1